MHGKTITRKVNRMRLLLLSSEFPPGPGGIGTHAYQLADNLCSRGWKVTVVARQDYADTTEIRAFNQQQQFRVVTLPHIQMTLLDAVQRWQIARHCVIKEKPDLLVASGSKATWIAAALPTDIPRIAIGHGTEFGFSGWQWMLTKWAFQRMEHVVCVSNYTKEYMLNKSIQPKAVSVIHNGADETAFGVLPESIGADFRKELRFSPDDRLLLTVGNVTARKGQDIVIRALPKILSVYPNVHYLIAGMPTEGERFSALADDLGVARNVHFLGRVPQDDLVKLYNVCDLFVMTSRETKTGDFEGYGIAVIEAALCGKPSVVTGGSGLAEAVADNETGLVVKPEDSNDTAQAILRLLQDDALRARLGAQAKQRALETQTWRKRILEYDLLFKEKIAP